MRKTGKDLFVTLCMLSGMTERMARKKGVAYFLPQLFKLRYAQMGDIAPELLEQQMEELHAFEENTWCDYWDAQAQQHEQALADAADEAAGMLHGRRALTYYSIAAFPGTSPCRIDAYQQARRLLEEEIIPRYLSREDDPIEVLTLKAGDEEVRGYAHFPKGATNCPMVIMTNGLEGTAAELLLPLQRYRDSGIGVFVMEMPGTYAYRKPMSAASTAIYNDVIAHFAADPRIDAQRIAFFGVSFGGYWAARMAAESQQLKCAVACGAPLHHSFTLQGGLGAPAIIIQALKKVSGASSLAGMQQKLAALSSRRNHFYERIRIPLLVVNGDSDTLVSPKDTLELAERVAGAELKLYENDDHCAMGHYQEMMAFTFRWIETQLHA